MSVLEEAARTPASGTVDPKKMTGSGKFGAEIRELRT